MKQKEIGIYIHIPFCIQKCFYCDFLSVQGGFGAYSSYIKALISEIMGAAYLKEYLITSIFIGGGTPTVLPAEFICKIMEALLQYPIAPDAEITIEANPKTLSKSMLASLHGAGFNRLSIGVQAWQDEFLKSLGRAHRQKDFVENYQQARLGGFQNINVDLMFGLPEQEFSHWQETLREIVSLGPEHISAYGLMIEVGTPFHDAFIKGELNLPDEDLERKLYWYTVEYLKSQGYVHYETSNFAKPGCYSRHNVLYWRRGLYKGFGLGAHSFMEDKRFSNTVDFNSYEEYTLSGKVPIVETTPISREDAMAEFMFLGLRLVEGIAIDAFFQAFHVPIAAIYQEAIDKNIARGLLVQDQGRLRLTNLGMDLSNRVMADFLF